MKLLIRFLLAAFVFAVLPTTDVLAQANRITGPQGNSSTPPKKNPIKKPEMTVEEMYAQGYDLYQSKDYTQAVTWFQKATDKGYDKAQYHLGVCYEKGLGVAQDYNQAVSWYRKAAEQELVKAQNSLGDCYAHGLGVETNYNQAVFWYRKAAEQGHPSAQNSLGMCYYKGNGVDKDVEKARYWWQKAAGQGDEDAKRNIEIANYVPMADGILYEYEKPTAMQIYEWKDKYRNICDNKIKNNYNDFIVPKDMIKIDPCLVYLILNSESINTIEDKQSWFDLYSLMDDVQMYHLYEILYREKRDLILIEKGYK